MKYEYSYLASPYSHADLAIMDERHDAAMCCVHWHLKNHIWVYSPIVHCHELARRYYLPRDYDFWETYNKVMLFNSNRLIILTLPGWDDSKGVKGEVDFANKIGRPITFIHPEVMEDQYERRS